MKTFKRPGRYAGKIGVAAVICCSALQASAGNWTVVSTDDDKGVNTFTLRDIINNHAAAGDTIMPSLSRRYYRLFHP